MYRVLIDTNCFVSLIDSSDKWNRNSLEILNELKIYNVQIILTDIVLNETINVLCKRLENKGRSNEIGHFLNLIDDYYSSELIVWISEDIRKYHNQILDLIRNSNGLLNYNDSFLIAYMIENDIRNIISFDLDFGSINQINRISNNQFSLS